MTKISLTPVIDIVFILLIFFMLATNFNKVGEIDMDTTKESNSTSEEDIKVIRLLINQDQTVISDGKVYDDNELVTMIKHAVRENEKYSIILSSKDDVTYQRFMYLMAYLKNNELNNINIGLKDNETEK
jgi:biopolymer transport protein ExbD